MINKLVSCFTATDARLSEMWGTIVD